MNDTIQQEIICGKTNHLRVLQMSEINPDGICPFLASRFVIASRILFTRTIDMKNICRCEYF